MKFPMTSLRIPIRLLASCCAIVLCAAKTHAEDRNADIVQSFFDQAERDSEGREWKPLFNGKDLEGWKVVLENDQPGNDPENIFQVVDGKIHVYRDTPRGKQMPFGVIITDGSYSDYRFRFEYKWGVKKFAPREHLIRDAGLLFHTIGEEKIWPTSVECQVQEGDVGDNYLVYTAGDTPVKPGTNQYLDFKDGGVLQSFYTPSSVTRVVKSETLELPGWNTVEVIVRGDTAVYITNGKINNYVTNMRAPTGPNGEMAPLTAGRLCLQCEGAELYYRNIEIMELDEPKAVSFVPQDESTAPIPARSPEEGLASWKVRDGLKVDLVAAEPLVLDPVAIDWSLDGKLWVVEMADYPMGMDNQGQPGGRIRVLGKSRQDGPYDQSTVLLSGLNFPNGIVCWKEGAIVTAAPDILYVADTDGDGICDVKEVLFSGFFEGNQQLRANGLRWGLDGWLHCASGSHYPGYGAGTRIHSHITKTDTVMGSGDFRFNPATGEIELISGPSQFGRNADEFGNWFGVQNSFPLWHYVFEERYLKRNPLMPYSESRQFLTESSPRLFPVAEILKPLNPHTRVGRFTSGCSGMVYQDSFLPLGTETAHAFTCDPVHNLVQRNLLSREGASFSIRRDAEGEEPDFLASTDPWCRPVMVRTGPDGALWVVDMYRYLIEHPEWVPDHVKEEMKREQRLGDGRGRIYRVLPADGQAREIPNVKDATPDQLVALLDHPNGWIRDAAQRRLLDINAPTTTAQLKSFLTSATTAQGRLHAAYALNTLKQLDSSSVLALLRDANPELRRHGLILAEQLPQLDADVLNQIISMVNDPSQVVLMQLAFSLGEWNAPAVHDAMASLWHHADVSPHIETALFSSLNPENFAKCMAVVLKTTTDQPNSIARLKTFFSHAIAYNDLSSLQQVVDAGTASTDGFRNASIALIAMYARPENANLISQLRPESVAAIHARARQFLKDRESSAGFQELSVPLLFRVPALLDADQEFTSEVLATGTGQHIQKDLIQHVGQQRDPAYGSMLVAGWAGYSPATREQVLDLFASHPEWFELLTVSIEEGTISPNEIRLEVQDRLLSHQTPVSKKLTTLLRGNAQPVMVTPEFTQDILQMEGNVQRGREVFRKNCIDCHQFQGEGVVVGPNLASVTGRTPFALLESILNPNKAVEPKYLNYSVGLNDGRLLSGVIANESSNSLVLQKAKDERTSVFKQEIDELRSTGKSLMPEGFERTIPAQDLADLIQFLQLEDVASSQAAAN